MFKGCNHPAVAEELKVPRPIAQHSQVYKVPRPIALPLTQMLSMAYEHSQVYKVPRPIAHHSQLYKVPRHIAQHSQAYKVPRPIAQHSQVYKVPRPIAQHSQVYKVPRPMALPLTQMPSVAYEHSQVYVYMVLKISESYLKYEKQALKFISLLTKYVLREADLKINKSAPLSFNHHIFSNTEPIYTELNFI